MNPARYVDVDAMTVEASEFPRRSLDPLAGDPFLAALRRPGATSWDSAVRRTDLPRINDDMLAAFIAARIIGRADAGRYYLAERPMLRNGPATFTPRRVALMTACWVVALLAPLVIWLRAR